MSERALFLLQQSRFDLAEQELRRELSNHPDNYFAHALLSNCYNHQEKFKAAEESAKTAISLEPNDPFCHYCLGIVKINTKNLKEAKEAAETAIRLDPENSTFYSLLSSVYLRAQQWDKALSMADKGLSLDPTDTDCQNYRAMALVKLGRSDDAHTTIHKSLREEPENADTHANLGWTFLHQGNHKKALEHFQEALRLEPDSEWARNGMLQALKARFLVYRLILKFFLWMSTLSSSWRYGMIIGIYIVFRVLRSVQENHPEYSMYLIPFIILYFAFIYLTWTATPMFNTLLRFNKFGRLILTKTERAASNWYGGLILVAIVAFVCSGLTQETIYVEIAIFCILMTLPLSRFFDSLEGEINWKVLIYILVIAAAGIVGILMRVIGQKDIGNLATGIFLLGLFLFTWGVALGSAGRPKIE